MSDATDGLNQFTAAGFTRLARNYPVMWTLIHGPAPAGMDCPYLQHGYTVCKISGVQTSVALITAPASVPRFFA